MEDIKNSEEKIELIKGVTVWFTGLPSAGKSTIARLLECKCRASGLKVELLDGDVIRTNLSKGLGFSKEDRDINIKRVGFVCDLLTRNAVISIAAVISPYREVRDYNRRRIGNFVEVYVKTSLAVCEKRDVKGLYRQAREGRIQNFTGVNDPYEEPLNAEVICDTERETPERSAQKVFNTLGKLGYLKGV